MCLNLISCPPRVTEKGLRFSHFLCAIRLAGDNPLSRLSLLRRCSLDALPRRDGFGVFDGFRSSAQSLADPALCGVLNRGSLPDRLVLLSRRRYDRDRLSRRPANYAARAEAEIGQRLEVAWKSCRKC